MANQLLPTRGVRRAQSPEESHPPPQDGEGEFSKMYRESVAQDKKLAQEKDREKSDAMNERWEKLESDRVARDVKALRTLVEEMNASQSELRRQLGNERAARLSLEQQVHASQQSLAVLERTVEKQAVELRVERQRGAAPSREQEHDSRKIAELTARVVDLDAALEEEREEGMNRLDRFSSHAMSVADVTAPWRSFHEERNHLKHSMKSIQPIRLTQSRSALYNIHLLEM